MSARTMIAWLMGSILTAAAPAAADEVAPSLDALAWLAGDWQGEGLGGHMQELWMPEAGGMMHGVFRLVVGGSVRFSEYLQITSEEAGVVMRFAHFRPDYSTWEGDGPPMELLLNESAPGLARFSALHPAAPERIEYRLREDGTLVVEVSGLPAPLEFRRAD